MHYKLLDSGDGQKLEQFGEVLLIRPAAGAYWKPQLSEKNWARADARFSREKGNCWELFRTLPETWNISIEAITLQLKRTDFGHLGVFPEHATLWQWMQNFPLRGKRVLNLFAYSGATTCALAAIGAKLTHVDASKPMIGWAAHNAALNGLEAAPIRWIVDDARKYLKRAVRRQEKYDAILLDPPSFGRGKEGEVFKIERDLHLILQQCKELLSDDPSFLLFTSHTSGYTPLVMQQLLLEFFANGKVDSGELFVKSDHFKLPSGTFARWCL